MKKLLITTILGMGLACASVRASLYEYIYTGEPFTESTDPTTPGVALTDRFLADFTLDDSLWGIYLGVENLDSPLRYGPENVNLHVGPFDLFSESTRVETDLAGQITFWSFYGLYNSGVEVSSGGLQDGSGRDNIFGNQIVPFVNDLPVSNAYASVFYAPGSPSRWVYSRVPDTGSSAVLLSLGVGALFFMRRVEARP